MTVLTKAQTKLLAAIALDDDGIEIVAGPRRTINALLSHALIERREDSEIGSRFVVTTRVRETAQAQTAPPPRGSKLEILVALMRRPEGATLAVLQVATGWQAHSVRGAIAGAIKKKLEHAVVSTKGESGRVYRIEQAEAA